MNKNNFYVTFFMSTASNIKEFQKKRAYSGGDNILINLLRKWQEIFNIEIFTWDVSEYYLKSFSIHKVRYHNIVKNNGKLRYPLSVLFTGFMAIKWALQSKKNKLCGFVYSPSDFFPDSIPAFILKLKNPEIIWIASLYLFFPNPFSLTTPYKGKRRIIGFLQYVLQLPSKYLIKWFADIVFVTSEPDKYFFITNKRTSEKVIVIKGGVNIEDFEKIKQQIIKYDGVFMGRFHPQKGLIELIHIWKLVTEKFPNSKLAIIGQGEGTPEERWINKEVISLINHYDLSKNIDFFGFLNGDQKTRIFKSCKVVVHPAIYDSGGMAAAEAMACGLPGVSFDLDALKTYYPKGMLKTNCFDLQKFADNIIKLLTNDELYKKLSEDAQNLVRSEWDWNIRADNIYKKLQEIS